MAEEKNEKTGGAKFHMWGFCEDTLDQIVEGSREDAVDEARDEVLGDLRKVVFVSEAEPAQLRIAGLGHWLTRAIRDENEHWEERSRFFSPTPEQGEELNLYAKALVEAWIVRNGFLEGVLQPVPGTTQMHTYEGEENRG